MCYLDSLKSQYLKLVSTIKIRFMIVQNKKMEYFAEFIRRKCSHVPFAG